MSSARSARFRYSSARVTISYGPCGVSRRWTTQPKAPPTGGIEGEAFSLAIPTVSQGAGALACEASASQVSLFQPAPQKVGPGGDVRASTRLATTFRQLQRLLQGVRGPRVRIPLMHRV